MGIFSAFRGYVLIVEILWHKQKMGFNQTGIHNGKREQEERGGGKGRRKQDRENECE